MFDSRRHGGPKPVPPLRLSDECRKLPHLARGTMNTPLRGSHSSHRTTTLSMRARGVQLVDRRTRSGRSLLRMLLTVTGYLIVEAIASWTTLAVSRHEFIVDCWQAVRCCANASLIA
jgi:hypothetical protein